MSLHLSADELRTALVEKFHQAQPVLTSYYEYARQAAALAQEYHAARLKEAFPAATFSERVLVLTCDGRETPASLDKKLAAIKASEVTITTICLDPKESTYYLFL